MPSAIDASVTAPANRISEPLQSALNSVLHTSPAWDAR